VIAVATIYGSPLASKAERKEGSCFWRGRQFKIFPPSFLLFLLATGKPKQSYWRH
jgi:hypothetical protein